MPPKNEVKLFEERQVRSVWDEDAGKWWFSVVDVVAVLTDQDDPLTARKYWNKLKQRLKEEGNESVTNCHQLKLVAADGKKYLTDVVDAEQVLRLVQSIPSKKAEPFKMWLAKVGSERIDETLDPEQSIDRAIQNYRRLGYSEAWITQRIKSIEIRKALTDEWDKSGVKAGKEYAVLTDILTKGWSGMTTGEYKKYKGLKKEGLRDHMTNTELILNMLAESATTDISIVQQPVGFKAAAAVAKDGASVAKTARKQLEAKTGRPAISQLNAKTLKQLPPMAEIILTKNINTGAKMQITLRQEEENDYRIVEELTREAFWNVHFPGCDEHLLVHNLRKTGEFVKELDFVAVHENKIVGNIMYAEAKVKNNELAHTVLTFGPLSVLPEYQNKGVGSKLINHTVKLAKEMNYKGIIIYGDPEYYKRFGFEESKKYNITNKEMKYPAALLVLELHKNALRGISGVFDEGSAYKLDPKLVEEFDRGFIAKEKGYAKSQDRFNELAGKFL